ncbi:uncharacterized protein CTRU02_204639 [Colletotrichum truncatum]|uniref:Uncharacterized protein n=1 Tax=Colletotrichum truncatum TaxID=5467 RepID=A0ACC3ZCP0_COLTU|nr:uncharacterized protein CTRU02_02871 [Colletotrichum truncatum]KAF6797829.1 hypothetical protein CTRU02_02871 [Colletotrichum truncatum]
MARYYQQHACDLDINGVDLEDFIEEYIEDYYRAQSRTIPVLKFIGKPSEKHGHKFKRLLHHFTKKKLPAH